MAGIDEESVDDDIDAGKTGFYYAAKYAAKTTGYEVWNFFTGGFLKRQDQRRELYDAGEISESEFDRGTSLDAFVSAGASAVGGAVANKVTGRLAGTALATRMGGLGSAAASGAAASATEDLIVQSGEVLANQTISQKLGRGEIDFMQTLAAAGTGAVTGAVTHQILKARNNRASSDEARITGETRAGPTTQSTEVQIREKVARVKANAEKIRAKAEQLQNSLTIFKEKQARIQGTMRGIVPDNPLIFKSSSGAGELYDPAKFAKVQAALEKQGVTFVTGDEGKRLANSLGGEALYWPAEPGKAGIMVFGPNPTRAQVIEEVLHFGQHKKSGFGEIGSQIVDLEIQAQDKLLNLGARKNWTTGELEQIQRAREQWLQIKNKSGQ
jgi:hypothetical protein